MLRQVLKFANFIALCGVLSATEKVSYRGALLGHKRMPLWELSEKAINASKANMRVNTDEFPTHGPSEVYKINFSTVDHQNKIIETTGLVILPTLKTEAPNFLSYHHATRMHSREAPTALPVDPEAQMNAIFLASNNTVVTMVDYLGLDKVNVYEDKTNKYPQFYLVADIQAKVAFDLLKATQEFLRINNRHFKNQLLIAGYSQGAHNALALHKYIQSHHPNEFKILGTSAMSGIYNISELTRKVIDQETKVKISPVFVALGLLGMHEAYEDFPRFKDLLLEPYPSTLPDLVRKGNFSAVRKNLPSNVDELLNMDLALDIKYEDDTHPFWRALVKNNVDNFKYNAPVLMIHSREDKVIPFDSAAQSFNRLQSLGNNIEFVEINEAKCDHVEAAFPAMIRTSKFFKALIR